MRVTPQHLPSTNATTETVLNSSGPCVCCDASLGITFCSRRTFRVWTDVPLNGSTTHIEHSGAHCLRRRQILRALNVILKLVLFVRFVTFLVHRAPRQREAASNNSVKRLKALGGSGWCPSTLGAIFHCRTPTPIWVVETFPLSGEVLNTDEVHVQASMATGINAFLSIAVWNRVRHPIHLSTVTPIVILLAIIDWINIRV